MQKYIDDFVISMKGSKTLQNLTRRIKYERGITVVPVQDIDSVPGKAFSLSLHDDNEIKVLMDGVNITATGMKEVKCKLHYDIIFMVKP